MLLADILSVGAKMVSPAHKNRDSRRKFLEMAGKCSLTVPPAMVLLLTGNGALAKSSSQGSGVGGIGGSSGGGGGTSGSSGGTSGGTGGPSNSSSPHHNNGGNHNPGFLGF